MLSFVGEIEFQEVIAELSAGYEDEKEVARQMQPIEPVIIQPGKATPLRTICATEQDYEALVKQSAVYIDKTEAIYRLLNHSSRQLFIVRPRRFGKTLLLNTIKCMYTNNDPENFFKGTWFGKNGPEKWNEIGQYPVVHLVMKDCPDTIDRLEEALIEICADALRRYVPEKVITSQEPSTAFHQMLSLINEKTKKPSIVLIDEYDKTIISCMYKKKRDKTLFEQVIEKLHAFYGIVKDGESERLYTSALLQEVLDLP